MPGREGRVDLFWKDSIQAHDTATERATTARMLPLDLLRAWPLFKSNVNGCFPVSIWFEIVASHSLCCSSRTVATYE
jgi:hypothetical protein